MYLNGQEAATFKGDFETSMNLIANLAIAQDGKAFGPGINKHTKLPSDFYVDYMRVWQPLDGFSASKIPEAENEANEQVIAAPVESSKIVQSNARAKKTKRFMRDKKNEKLHMGFISLTQDKSMQLLFEKNGIFEITPTVIIADRDLNKLSSIELNENQVYLSVRDLKKGVYFVKLNVGNASDWVQLKI